MSTMQTERRTNERLCGKSSHSEFQGSRLGSSRYWNLVKTMCLVPTQLSVHGGTYQFPFKEVLPCCTGPLHFSSLG